MKKCTLFLAFNIFCGHLFSQVPVEQKYYLSNAVSLGVGITKGLIEEKLFNGEIRSVNKGETNFAFGYQIIAGFILNPENLTQNKFAIETGLSINYNAGEVINKTSNDKLKLQQASYGIPISLMALKSAKNYKIKYGAGIIFQRNFYKEISGNNNYKSRSWSLFKDGRIGLIASGTYFHKVKNKNAFWGIGLQISNDLNSNYNPETRIPFTLRKTNFTVNFYPFLWFFNN